MIPMNDPRYRYQPWTQERRDKAAAQARARLGIPEGHCRIYGENVPLDLRDEIRPMANEIARTCGQKKAGEFVRFVLDPDT